MLLSWAVAADVVVASLTSALVVFVVTGLSCAFACEAEAPEVEVVHHRIVARTSAVAGGTVFVLVLLLAAALTARCRAVV